MEAAPYAAASAAAASAVASVAMQRMTQPRAALGRARAVDGATSSAGARLEDRLDCRFLDRRNGRRSHVWLLAALAGYPDVAASRRRPSPIKTSAPAPTTSSARSTPVNGRIPAASPATLVGTPAFPTTFEPVFG